MTGLRGRRLLYPADRERLLRSNLLRRAHQKDQRGRLRGRAQAAAGLHLPASLRGDTAACVTAQPCSRQPGKVLQPYGSWSLNKLIWKPAVHPISRAASNTGDTGCNWHLWQLQEDSYCNPLLTPLSRC